MRFTRLTLPTILALGLLAATLAGEAQQAGKVYRIGVLTGGSTPSPRAHSPLT
jgi:hypothetical protein